MKLYATVTSDRASKGQGGNKQIVVDLLIDPIQRLEVGRVVMECVDNIYTIYYYPINENCTDQAINNGRILLYQTKGNNQKGVCLHDWDNYGKCTTCKVWDTQGVRH